MVFADCFGGDALDTLRCEPSHTRWSEPIACFNSPARGRIGQGLLREIAKSSHHPGPYTDVLSIKGSSGRQAWKKSSTCTKDKLLKTNWLCKMSDWILSLNYLLITSIMELKTFNAHLQESLAWSRHASYFVGASCGKPSTAEDKGTSSPWPTACGLAKGGTRFDLYKLTWKENKGVI